MGEVVLAVVAGAAGAGFLAFSNPADGSILRPVPECGPGGGFRFGRHRGGLLFHRRPAVAAGGLPLGKADLAGVDFGDGVAGGAPFAGAHPPLGHGVLPGVFPGRLCRFGLWEKKEPPAQGSAPGKKRVGCGAEKRPFGGHFDGGGAVGGTAGGKPLWPAAVPGHRLPSIPDCPVSADSAALCRQLHRGQQRRHQPGKPDYLRERADDRLYRFSPHRNPLPERLHRRGLPGRGVERSGGKPAVCGGGTADGGELERPRLQCVSHHVLRPKPVERTGKRRLGPAA